MVKTVSDIRYEPLYTPTDISKYARVHPETLRTWAGSKGRLSVLTPEGKGVAPFSFINLIEAHVLVALRKNHKVPMQRIRKGIRWMSEHFDTDHPLAEVDLETDGRDLFAEHLNLKVAVSKGGQIAIPEVVRLYLQRIDRDTTGPVRFYPFTSGEICPKLIVMDPAIDFGRPTVAGTRIDTVMILDRFEGGESLATIADDYNIKLEAVEEALRCERERRAA